MSKNKPPDNRNQQQQLHVGLLGKRLAGDVSKWMGSYGFIRVDGFEGRVYLTNSQLKDEGRPTINSNTATPSGTLLRVELERRWFKSMVNSHSSLPSYERDMNLRLNALNNEMSLSRYLISQGHRLVDAQGRPPAEVSDGPLIHVRLLQGLLNYHDSDNSAALLLGEHSSMVSFAASVTERLQAPHEKAPSLITSDRACGLIALPLSDIINKTKEEVLVSVKEVIKENDAISSVIGDNIERAYNGHSLSCIPIGGKGPKREIRWSESCEKFLNESDKKFCPWLPSDVLIEPRDISVLLAVWNWKDNCCVGLPSGKRALGETSLECCLRQTLEETIIDLSDVPVRAKRHLVVRSKDIKKDWMLTLHLQSRLNYYLFMHGSMFRR